MLSTLHGIKKLRKMLSVKEYTVEKNLESFVGNCHMVQDRWTNQVLFLAGCLYL